MGLTETDVESIAKSRLLAAGLFDPEAEPHLYISIQVVDKAFSLRVEFLRWVQGELMGGRHATVWSSARTGVTSRASFIKDRLRDHLDHFVAEFLTVNNSDICVEIRRQRREAAR